MTESPPPPPSDPRDEASERVEHLRLENQVLRRQLTRKFLLLEWAKAIAAPLAILGFVATVVIFLIQRGDLRQQRDDERFERAITRVGSTEVSERLTGIAGLAQFLDTKDAGRQRKAMQYLVNAAAIEPDATVRSAILDVFAGLGTARPAPEALNDALISVRDRNRAILNRYRNRFFTTPLVNDRFPSGEGYSEVPIGKLSDEEREPLEATASIMAALIRVGAKVTDLSQVYCVGCKLGRDDTVVDLSHANFDGAFLRFADFTDADLSGASFHNADLILTRFTNANLRGAKLTADVPALPWAELAAFAANNLLAMHGASFACADLSEADFTGRPIFVFIYKNPVIGSNSDNFTGANLRRTKLTGFQFILGIPANLIKDLKSPNPYEIQKIFPVTWGQAGGPSQTVGSVEDSQSGVGKQYVLWNVATGEDFQFTGSFDSRDFWDVILTLRDLRRARNLFEAEMPEGLKSFLQRNEKLLLVPLGDPGCKPQPHQSSLRDATIPAGMTVLAASVTEWLTSLGTVGACVIALIIALFGKRMEHWTYRPDLRLEAVVKSPDGQKVGRFIPTAGGYGVSLGDAWFFRLRITNVGSAPAREVQVYLARVERLDDTPVDRFSPMNLKWTHIGETTRKVLLPEIPVFCDFIHVGDPAFRAQSGDDLDTVPPQKAVLALDVEATSTAQAHLLEPGGYRFHLWLAAENFRATHHKVEVRYDGTWTIHQDQMFDHAIGFRMGKV